MPTDMDWCLSKASVLGYAVAVLSSTPLEDVARRVSDLKVIYDAATWLADKCIQNPEARRYAEMLADLASRATDVFRKYEAGDAGIGDVASEVVAIVSQWRRLVDTLHWGEWGLPKGSSAHRETVYPFRIR